MEGFEVFTSDDCKDGHVIDVQAGHLIVEHCTLRQSKHAVVAEHYGLAEAAEFDTGG